LTEKSPGRRTSSSFFFFFFFFFSGPSPSAVPSGSVADSAGSGLAPSCG
jgi:hypothetical protein